MPVTVQDTFKPGLSHSIPATADITEGCFVSFSGGLCGNHAQALGVCSQDVDSGDEMPVVLDGIVSVELAGTVAVGDALTSNASGKAIKSTDSTWAVNGWALKAGVSGEFIPVKLQ